MTHDKLPGGGLDLQSTPAKTGSVTIALQRANTPAPGPDQVVIRLAAAAIGARFVPPPLAKLGPQGVERLRTGAVDEIPTTSATSSGVRLSPCDAVHPERLRRYGRMSTGYKAFVLPDEPVPVGDLPAGPPREVQPHG